MGQGGQVKICDFGLARVLGRESGGGSGSGSGGGSSNGSEAMPSRAGTPVSWPGFHVAM